MKNENITVRSTWGNFVVVPVTLLESSLSSSARLVWISLMSRVNHSESEACVYPGYEAIMSRCGITGRTTIAKALDELESAGWLKRTKRFSGSTLYTLTLPVVQKVDDSSPETERLPVVQKVDCISPESGLPLVQKVDPNKNHLTRTIEQESVPRDASRADDSPAKRSRAKLSEAESARHKELFDAITATCVLDAKLQGGIIAKTAKQLREADATASAQRLREFLEWWKRNDFRGRQGKPPTAQQLLASWRQFSEGFAEIPKVMSNAQPIARGVDVDDMVGIFGDLIKERNGNE
jgi:hypothetical protein